jgi:hypothetical protein
VFSSFLKLPLLLLGLVLLRLWLKRLGKRGTVAGGEPSDDGHGERQLELVFFDFVAYSSNKTIYSSNYNGYLVRCTGKYKGIGSKYGRNNIKQNIITNDALPYVELTSKSYDTNVFGVLTDRLDDDRGVYKTGAFVSNWKKDKGDDRVIVNGVGEGSLWVSDIGGSNIQMGDYLCSSSISGIAMKQHDDLLHNYTVAKITMDCDFEPKWIPVEVIKQEPYNYWGTSNIDVGNGSNIDIPVYCTTTSNVIDENGYPVYEYKLDESSNIVYDYEYDMKYITLNGNIVDKDYYLNNSNVYRMAFVGCTYKCS